MLDNANFLTMLFSLRFGEIQDQQIIGFKKCQTKS